MAESRKTLEKSFAKLNSDTTNHIGLYLELEHLLLFRQTSRGQGERVNAAEQWRLKFLAAGCHPTLVAKIIKFDFAKNYLSIFRDFTEMAKLSDDDFLANDVREMALHQKNNWETVQFNNPGSRTYEMSLSLAFSIKPDRSYKNQQAFILLKITNALVVGSIAQNVLFANGLADAITCIVCINANETLEECQTFLERNHLNRTKWHLAFNQPLQQLQLISINELNVSLWQELCWWLSLPHERGMEFKEAFLSALPVDGDSPPVSGRQITNYFQRMADAIHVQLNEYHKTLTPTPANRLRG